MGHSPFRIARILSIVLGASLVLACSEEPSRTTTTTAPAAPSGTEQATAEKCAAHGAPKDLCFICDASLREKGRLWCQEHSRYEDRCWECHPELEDKARLYCKEHSLYEDECFLCHPELKSGKTSSTGAAPGEPSAAALMCKEHAVPEAECGICHPELLDSAQPGTGLKVRLPSSDSASKAGVVASSPTAGPSMERESFLAELTFDQNKMAHITAVTAGVVESVEVDLGSRVKRGQLLARLRSDGMGEAESAYLQAAAEANLRAQTVARERELHAERISSLRDLQQAEADHQAAVAAVRATSQRLRVLGFGERQIEALAQGQRSASLLEVRAPFSGEIIARTAVRGTMAEANSPLFTLTDTSSLWAIVSLPESQFRQVSVGHRVDVTVDSLPGEIFSGVLTWVAPEIEERTRLARARVEIANPSGRLKAHMFGRARILGAQRTEAVTVQPSVVQRIAGKPVVFVQLADDLYEARRVELGASGDRGIEILAGLRPSDRVVVQGAFTLKSQFLISRLGAGCVD